MLNYIFIVNVRNNLQLWSNETAPLLNKYYSIEIRVLWTEMKYIKSASRLLNRAWVNKGGLDLWKEVLWVSVDQRAAELPAIKVGGKSRSTFNVFHLCSKSPHLNSTFLARVPFHSTIAVHLSNLFNCHVCLFLPF